MSRRSARRVDRLSLGRATVVGLIVLAACGGGGVDDASTGESDGRAAFPVTIASKWGSQTIGSQPVRVVTLDNQATDAALTLGVVPVGIAEVSFVPGGMQKWTERALEGEDRQPERINVDQGIPFERVAALEPDIILGTNAWQLDEQDVYDTLSRIAPTVHFTESALGDTWQDTTRRVGLALGRSEEAKGLVNDMEGRLAAVLARTPGLEGRTVTLFNADPSGLYAISSPDDYAMKFLAALGLRISPRIDELADEYPGRAPISPERFDVLESDILVGTSVSQEAFDELNRNPVFAGLEAVKAGRYLELDIGAATSMAFPSVLSIGWALDNVVPTMEAAVEAR